MKIHDAVAEALEKNAYIRRSGLIYSEVLIKPTNSYDCCIILIKGREGQQCRQCRYWNPTADDLVADDWGVVEKLWNE